MDLPTAHWLVSAAAEPLLALAQAESDPGSLGAGTRMRALTTPERAAAVLSQVALRRRARAKFGSAAEALFFTPVGLEQATRGGVAVRRAARFAAAGASAVIDLGCGIGADALACRDRGLRVAPVERDPVTAVLASANLGVEVTVSEAQAAWPLLAAADPDAGVFADPARRTGAGRTWRVEDLSPPWDFAIGLLTGQRPAALKLGPGVPHRLVPPAADAEWVSDAGTVVECALWAGPGAVPGRRAAVVDGVELVASGAPSAEVSAPQAYVYEPDGAVVRAGLTDELAGLLRADRLDPHAAYLTAPHHLPTTFADAFALAEVLPFDEKVLRGWVRERGIGALEIKKRGLDVDPAALRRRLKPRGRESATIILTPTPQGALAMICARV